MNEWKKCRKLPITVKYREVHKDGEYIDTEEGTMYADPELDYIVIGINGEIYPIKKVIFDKSFEVLESGK